MMLLMDELKEWKNSFLSLRTCYVKEAILLLSYTVIYSAVGGQNFAICDQTVTLHYSCNIKFGASLFFRNLLRRDNALIQVCIYALQKSMSSTMAMQQIDKQRVMVILISTIANLHIWAYRCKYYLKTIIFFIKLHRRINIFQLA